MTDLTPISFAETDIQKIADREGRIAVFAAPEGRLDAGTRRINKLTRGAVARLVASEAFGKLKPGQGMTLAYPGGLAAEAVDVIHMPRRVNVRQARRAGATLAKSRGKSDLLVLAASMGRVAEVVFGLAMRDYSFTAHKSDAKPREGSVTVMCSKPDDAKAAAEPLMALAEGVFMTRDLTNAPANVLTTTSFAEQLAAMTVSGSRPARCRTPSASASSPSPKPW